MNSPTVSARVRPEVDQALRRAAEVTGLRRTELVALCLERGLPYVIGAYGRANTEPTTPEEIPDDVA